jgi:hypothetical protein
MCITNLTFIATTTFGAISIVQLAKIFKPTHKEKTGQFLEEHRLQTADLRDKSTSLLPFRGTQITYATHMEDRGLLPKQYYCLSDARFPKPMQFSTKIKKNKLYIYKHRPTGDH